MEYRWYCCSVRQINLVNILYVNKTKQNYMLLATTLGKFYYFFKQIDDGADLEKQIIIDMSKYGFLKNER